MKPTVLIVDDEQSVRLFLRELMEEEDFIVHEAANGAETISQSRKVQADLIILDLKLPDANGLDLIPKLLSDNPKAQVIIISALGTVDNAVKSIKLGAFDFITKPFDIDNILITIRRAMACNQLADETQAIKQKALSKGVTESFVGRSDQIEKIKDLIGKLKNTQVPILITGETGTGKNVLARQIHNKLSGKDKPLVYINSATIPDTLFESELFGHEKGSFTGAHTQKKGRVEKAHGGSLILDEITEIPLRIQPKLLDFIQEMTFCRIGGNHRLKVSTRVIALSNCDLYTEMEKGRFRKDLYYRLNLIHLRIPPLRDRVSDIPLLTRRFLQQFRQKYGRQVTSVEKAALNLLINHEWKGNVRELKNVLERAYIQCDGNRICTLDIVFEEGVRQTKSKTLKDMMADYERKVILKTLSRNRGNRQKTADDLSISIRALHYKLNKYQITSA